MAKKSPKNDNFLQDLARDHVGDRKSPPLYFVGDGTRCLMVTSDKNIALMLAEYLPGGMIEDRAHGVVYDDGVHEWPWEELQ